MLFEEGWLTLKFSCETAKAFKTSASMASSSRSIRSIFSRICCRAASEHRAAKSDPTWPCVSAATYKEERNIFKKSEWNFFKWNKEHQEECKQYLFANVGCTHPLQVNILGQLHVLCMDTQDLKTTRRVGDSDVNLTIEATWIENQVLKCYTKIILDIKSNAEGTGEKLN